VAEHSTGPYPRCRRSALTSKRSGALGWTSLPSGKDASSAPVVSETMLPKTRRQPETSATADQLMARRLRKGGHAAA